MGFLGALPAIASVAGPLISAASNFIGAREQADAVSDANANNAALQREFAQNGIRWKVEDAKAAGISPLAALGAQSTSFAPSYVGDSGIGNSYSAMGQDISRAIDATSTYGERVSNRANQATMDKLTLDNAALQNQLLASQIAKLNQSGPPLPSNSLMPLLTGQGDSPHYVSEQPLTRIHSQPGTPQQEVGAISDYGLARTKYGYAIVPSKDVKDRIEDQIIPELMWAARNQLAPNLGMAPPLDPAYYPLPSGYSRWRWSSLHQEYRPSN